MKIEAVTVCIRYGDFLRQVAPFNRALLERWIVVTSPEDEKTRSVCRDHSIECVLTQDTDRDPPFAKACAINKGLGLLRGNSWLLHLDADICLPFDLHQCLHDAQLRKGSIHGVLRVNVCGREQWQEVKEQGLFSRQHGWLVEFAQRPVQRVGGLPASRQTGWLPVGYFQLWHGSETHAWDFPRKWYPEQHGNAARTDVQFALQWDRRDRVLIPELVVFHLESQAAPMGANWQGRTTRAFDEEGY